MSDDVRAEPGEQGSGFRFRDTTRAPFTTDVRLRFDRLGGAVSAETADISMEGMFVKTAEPRPVGTLVQFEFDLEDGETVQGLGDVVWVRARGSENKPAGMGIQFRYVDPKSREHVFKIVSNFISKISGSEAMPSIPTDGPPEENPIPTGTVAVPLSSLPGLGDDDDISEPAEIRAAPEPTDVLDSTPPPPPPTAPTDDGPFGSLLRGRADAGPEASKGALSGSFSLSVPRHEAVSPESDHGLPALSDAPDFLAPPASSLAPEKGAAYGARESSRESLSATVDYGTPGSRTGSTGTRDSGVLAGGVASEPALAGNGLRDSSGVAKQSDSPNFFDSPSADPPPVEPYVPSRDATELYGGSARVAGGGRRAWLLGALLLAAAAAALFVYRPWEALIGGSSVPDGAPSEQRADGVTAPPPAVGPAESVDSAGAETPSGPRVGFVQDSPADTAGAGTAEGELPAAEEPSGPESVSSPDAAATPGTPDQRAWPRDGRLGGVEAISGSGQTLVRITADRPLGPEDFETAALSAPPRYLVKLRGLDAAYSGGIEGLMFRGLRSGVHRVDGRSELHLVFDMTSAGFEANAELVNGEILVTFR